MNKHILLFVLPLFLGLFAYSQQKSATISFNENVHDFGTIKESDGKATCSFEFTNTGSEPLIINNVKTSCGCTTPGWSKEPILPGKKGFVKATYYPRNRPGRFNKSITVYSNAPQSTKVLRIKGNVTPRPKTLADQYPRSIGQLRLKTNHIAFSKIANTKVETKSVEIVNDSQEPVKISFDRVPKHIKLVAEPSTLKPKEKGKIVATYDAKIKNGLGIYH